jgi:hypothetical protein
MALADGDAALVEGWMGEGVSGEKQKQTEKPTT